MKGLLNILNLLSMEKEISQKQPRADRREMLRLNEQFDKMLDACIHEIAIHGDTESVSTFITSMKYQWRDFATKHNNYKKNRLHADPAALHKQLEQYQKNLAKQNEAAKVRKNKAAYDRWIAKVTMRYPRLMWRWQLINRVKKTDYVKEKYEEFQGKSPKGYWS